MIAPISTVAPVGEYGILAYIYALLLDADRASKQLDYLAHHEEPAVIEQIEQLKSAVKILPPAERLASLDRQAAKLRDPVHVSRLLKCAYSMVDILPPDNWHTSIVYLILYHRLAPRAVAHQEIYHSIEDVWAEVVNILGTLARLTSERPQDASYSFEAGLMRLSIDRSHRVELPPKLHWREFQTDLSKIAVANLKVKKALIAACLEIWANQRQIPTDGADLLLSISILLDCPIPPLRDRSAARQRAI